MTGITPWAMAPQEGLGVVMRILAIIGGAALGGLFVGWLGKLFTRLLTTKPMPLWGTRVLRLLGGVVSGWLVALLVFGGVGSGVGGPGGSWFGGNSADKDNAKKEKEDTEVQDKKDREKETPIESKELRVEVLGEKTLKLLKQSTEGVYRGFRIEGDKQKRFYEVEGLKEELGARKRRVPGLRVTLVFYKDSPEKDLNEVPQLVSWLQDEKMFDRYDPTNRDSPEVRQNQQR